MIYIFLFGFKFEPLSPMSFAEELVDDMENGDWSWPRIKTTITELEITNEDLQEVSEYLKMCKEEDEEMEELRKESIEE